MEGVSDVPDMDDLLDKLELSSEDFASPKISDHNGRADIKPVLYRSSEIRICPKDPSGNSLEKTHQKEERKPDQKVENSEEKRHKEEKFEEEMYKASQKKADLSSADNKPLLNEELRGNVVLLEEVSPKMSDMRPESSEVKSENSFQSSSVQDSETSETISVADESLPSSQPVDQCEQTFISNSENDKNSGDAEAMPDPDIIPTAEFSEEQVQIVKDVVGTALEDNEAREDKSDSGSQNFIADEPIPELPREQVQMVQENIAPDVEDETIAKDEMHESSNNTMNSSVADMPNDYVNKIGTELPELSTSDQKKQDEIPENIEEKPEDDIFAEIDRMQKMIQQEQEDSPSATINPSDVLSSTPVICAGENEIMACYLVPKESLTIEEETFLSAKSDVSESGRSLEAEDETHSTSPIIAGNIEEFSATTTDLSPKRKISTLLVAPVICANEDEIMTCSLVEKGSLSNDEEDFLSAKGDMDDSNQSYENENFAILDEERKFNDFQEIETQTPADQSQDGICEAQNSIEREAQKVDSVAENANENACDVPCLASENGEKGGIVELPVVEDKIGATCSESSHLDGPLEDQTVSEFVEDTDSKENIHPTELQPSTSSNGNIEPKNVDAAESNSVVLNNQEESRTGTIETVIVEEETSNIEEQVPSTSAGVMSSEGGDMNVSDLHENQPTMSRISRSSAANERRRQMRERELLLENPVSTAITDTDPNEEAGPLRKSVVASTHDISVINEEFKLTESELQLAKMKPYWIPDEDCQNCMLCSSKFTIVNRRHHCRSCGRVLCGGCLPIRRMLPYMSESDKKQRVCAPCNKTLDRISEYEKFLAEQNAANEQSTDTNGNPSDSQQSQADPAASLEQKRNSLPQPVRKKSVLKVRTASIIESESSSTGVAATDPENGSDANIEGNPSVDTANSENINPTLNQSNVIALISPPSVLQPQPKRSVTFLDGVNPGSDAAMEASSHRNSDMRSGEDGDSDRINRLRKPQKVISRRAMEKRVEEEQTSLLFLQPEYLFITNSEAQLTRTNVFDIMEKINNGERANIAIKRNLQAIVQRSQFPLGETTNNVWCITTRGFHFIGADELLLVWECRPPKSEESKDAPKDPPVDSASGAEVESLNPVGIADTEELEQQDLIDAVVQIEEIFTRCLTPTEDTLDDRMGIRRCVNRMSKMYSLSKGSLAGIEASALLFHRPQGQVFHDLALPSTPFMIGTLLKRDEVPWAIAIPNRVVYALGKQTSYYPIPLTNRRQRSPVFDAENTHASVLKVFNDFRNWSYRMAKLPGSSVSLSDSRTQVSLPDWALEELKLIVETNRNMVGWALDFNDRADSHLVCEHNENSGVFQTHIFASHGTTRQVTGATFIIFDGALKSSAEKFVISVVEDGIVVRMQADTMTELVKSLLSGEDFRLQSPNMDLCIEFYSTMSAMHSQGALISPIDGENLTGKFQYGLVLSRQFRSQNFFISLSEWALRLSAVINMDKGKFPSALQPKFFEVCEQLVVTISATLEPFVPSLVKNNRRTICLRFQVTDETAWYKTDEWSELDDEMAAQHYMWTSILDEQMVPFLYSLCARVPNGLYIEMHMAIISVRPLPIGTRDIG